MLALDEGLGRAEPASRGGAALGLLTPQAQQ